MACAEKEPSQKKESQKVFPSGQKKKNALLPPTAGRSTSQTPCSMLKITARGGFEAEAEL